MNVTARIRTTAVALGLVLTSTLALAACANETTYGHASRAVIYQSLDQLVGDATLVVTGTVTGVATEEALPEDGGPPLTVFTFAVDESLSPAGLADGLRELGLPAEAVDKGASINVLQYGTTAEEAGDAPRLEGGQAYLLFLNPTMLPGEHASDYYITGVEAGLYSAQGASVTEETIFVSASDDGDQLPKELSPADLRG